MYYTHWRASKIAQDLALGPKGLEAFIRQFDQASEMLSYPWLEGVIYLNKPEKKLIFGNRKICRLFPLGKTPVVY